MTPLVDPYRTTPPEALEARQRAEQTRKLAETFRQAMALLWLSHDRAGPRLNVIACAEGLGLGDSFNPEDPPAWLKDIIGGLTLR